MKIIDLLNKIANEEEVPKEIKYRDWLYEFDNSCKDYLCQYDSLLYRDNENTKNFLNDEVEIIEEPQEHKIPEKLNLDTDKLRGKETPRTIDYLIEDKINEILDYLEKIK